MNKREDKAFLYSRKKTNKWRRNDDGIKKKPFGHHYSNNLVKKHQQILNSSGLMRKEIFA